MRSLSITDNLFGLSFIPHNGEEFSPPWDDELTESDALKRIDVSDACYAYFRRIDRIQLGGKDAISGGPLFLFAPEEDFWPRFDPHDVAEDPCSFCHTVPLDDFRKFNEMGIVSGIARDRVAEKNRIESHPERFVPAIFTDVPHDLLYQFHRRFIPGHGIFMSGGLVSTGRGGFPIDENPEDLCGLSNITITSVGDHWTGLSKFTVSDPVLASSHSPWMIHVPKGVSFTYLLGGSREDVVIVPFDSLRSNVFTSSVSDISQDGIYVSPFLYPQDRFSESPLFAATCDFSHTPIAITPNENLLTPCSALSSLPHETKARLKKYRRWKPGTASFERGRFYCLTSDCAHLLQKKPSNTISSLRKRFPWVRQCHDGFSLSDIAAHDRFLKLSKSEEWQNLPPSGNVFTAEGETLTLDFFTTYFSKDPECCLYSPVSKKTIYRPITFDKLRSNNAAFLEFLLTLKRKTPFLLDLLRGTVGGDLLFAEMLSR
jgi:hypothetical protein